jgi:predicted RecB family nuclease
MYVLKTQDSGAPQRLMHSATDITSFLECEALTALNLRALYDPDLAAQRIDLDEGMKLIADKGMAHERAYRDRLIAEGRRLVDLAELPTRDLDARVQSTRLAMADGADVIYQATLALGDMVGHADFLLKVDAPSDLGPWSYEVADTKLAQSARAKFLVQLCFYSQLLEPVQGVAPQYMHVVLGDQSVKSFRCADYRYYVDALLERYRSGVQALQEAPDQAAYPLPCDHCAMCDWRVRCEEIRLADDHLCQIAGVRKQQIVKLERAGIRTMAALGALPHGAAVPQLNPDTLTKLQQQARLQCRARAEGRLHFELLEVPVGSLRGFERMPRPDDGDLFFDMEGDPLQESGLEYLFGFWYRQQGQWDFKAFWAHNREEERQAFEACMDFIAQRRREHPGLHVHHYASYEESALKRLASDHATREVELDDLLRGHVLVDLYKVVREALCISQPSYSIKYVEHFYRPPRSGDVTNAGASIVFYERWRETQDPQLLQNIAHYNRDDVESTQQLRDWLLTLRPTTTPWRIAHSKPASAGKVPTDGSTKSEAVQMVEARLERYRQRFLEGQPTDRNSWSANDHLRELTWQLLGFHRRATKPQWWSIFSKADLTEEELLDDPECMSGLTLDPDARPVRLGSKTRYTFIVPPQDSKLGDGDGCTFVHSAMEGPAIQLDEERGRLMLEVDARHEPLPAVLHLGPRSPIRQDAVENAVFQVADSLFSGSDDSKAIRQFLLRQAPDILGHKPHTPIVLPGEDLLQACVRAVSNLNRSYLYVQGPPGAGKTYTGSHMIAALLAQGRRVGVMSNSHKAIHHLMKGAIRVAKEQGVAVSAVKKASRNSPDSMLDADGARVINVYNNADVLTKGGNLIGGTVFLFAALEKCVDYLFVDEAGQVALANLVAASRAAHSLVLLGDQMQLGQPTQGVHPGRSGESSLEYLLDGAATIAPQRGIFLSTTWRMHPDVCGFISDAVYEGRLHPEAHTARRALVLGPEAHPALRASGIVHLPVQHTGCSLKSQEEAEVIRQIYRSAMAQQYIDALGQVHQMNAENVLVVAPYNMQVKLLKRMLPSDARVGTVDKFQGQEAELVIVSMTTSSESDLPRYLAFLYSKNRLNVAISRAKCTAIVLANSALLAIKCKQPEEMALVNTLCWLARGSSPSSSRTSG